MRWNISMVTKKTLSSYSQNDSFRDILPFYRFECITLQVVLWLIIWEEPGFVSVVFV